MKVFSPRAAPHRSSARAAALTSVSMPTGRAGGGSMRRGGGGGGPPAGGEPSQALALDAEEMGCAFEDGVGSGGRETGFRANVRGAGADGADELGASGF